MPPHHPLANGTPNGTGNEDDHFSVLVTGFGPFQERYPVNPSWEIARTLPGLLPAGGSTRRIRIVTCNGPIRVSYARARQVIPELLEANTNTVDLVLNIGMASGRNFYTAERLANRSGYTKHKDVDGQMPPADEVDQCFSDCPDSMTTSIDYDAMLKQWQATIRGVPAGSPAYGADCRQSDDAGHFLCDYTYFNTLAWFGRRNSCMEGGKSNARPVMFLHVPAESDAVDLQRGREVAIALIRAMVDNYER